MEIHQSFQESDWIGNVGTDPRTCGPQSRDKDFKGAEDDPAKGRGEIRVSRMELTFTERRETLPKPADRMKDEANMVSPSFEQATNQMSDRTVCACDMRLVMDQTVATENNSLGMYYTEKTV